MNQSEATFEYLKCIVCTECEHIIVCSGCLNELVKKGIKDCP